jgi:hypothetical protein
MSVQCPLLCQLRTFCCLAANDVQGHKQTLLNRVPPVNERAGDPNIAFGVGKFAGLTGVIGAFSTHDVIARTTPHEAGVEVPSIARGCLAAYSLKFF